MITFVLSFNFTNLEFSLAQQYFIFQDKRYDLLKRKRHVVPEWKTKWPWLEEDTKEGTMFCRWCREFPAGADTKGALFKGTTNFKTDPLKSHASSACHMTCTKVYLRSQPQSTADSTWSSAVARVKQLLTPDVDTTLIGKALKKTLTDPQREKFCVLMNTAYAVAKKGKAYYD